MEQILITLETINYKLLKKKRHTSQSEWETGLYEIMNVGALTSTSIVFIPLAVMPGEDIGPVSQTGLRLSQD